MAKWLTVKNSGKRGEMYLYGDIVTDKWLDSDVAPEDVRSEIEKLKEFDEVDIYINSPGGEVFAGMAIHAMIKRLKAKKRVYVDGVAASIASVIALAGDELHIPENAMFMIHNPAAMAWGEAEDMRKMAETLDKVKKSIIAIYREKVDTSDEEISKLMDEQTWMTGEEAVLYGFADHTSEPIPIAASLNRDNILTVIKNRYKNAPEIEVLQDSAKLPAEPIDHRATMAKQQTIQLMEALAC